MRGWLALVLVGCYDPHAPANVPCVDTCPMGQICSAGVCRTMIVDFGDAMMHDAAIDADIDASIDGPPGDVDGDTVDDLVDNCPQVANRDQHDEDGDRRGDACDVCPHLNDAGVDGDNDGVGDACDPHVSIPGDHIAVFDPFTRSTGQWIFDKPSKWVFASDSLTATVPAEYSDATIARAPANGEIVIGGSVVWSSTLPHQVALSLGTDAEHYYGELYDDGAKYAGLTHYDGSYSPVDQAPLSSFPSSTFVIDMVPLVGDRLSARLTLDGVTSSLAGLTPNLGGTQIQLFAQHATVKFDYFIQITSP